MLVWTEILLPIIQFLIGPIIAGYTVWYFTNKKTHKKEKDAEKRQLNTISAKLKRIIELVENLNSCLVKNNEYSDALEKMRNGDFSSVQEEVEQTGSQNNCIRLYEDLKSSNLREIGKLKQPINKAAIELSELPRDLLPPNIHGELMNIIESKKIELDLEVYRLLLRKIDNKL